MALSPDGRALVAAGAAPFLLLWTLEDAGQRFLPLAVPGPVTGVRGGGEVGKCLTSRGRGKLVLSFPTSGIRTALRLEREKVQPALSSGE